jgi:hypothetical protein
MDSERRRTPRLAFGGVVELSAPDLNVYLVAKTTEVSRFGCFVRTPQTLPLGAGLSLKITHEGNEFNASGRVAYVLPQRGVGISFTAATDGDNELLGRWLGEAGAE